MNIRRIPFSLSDERCLASTARWGMLIALVGIGSGTLELIDGIAAHHASSFDSSSGISLTPLLVVGVFAFKVFLDLLLFRAAWAFRKVARTDEADQVYLLRGFRWLRYYFMIQVLLVIVSVVAVALVLFPAALFGLGRLG